MPPPLRLSWGLRRAYLVENLLVRRPRAAFCCAGGKLEEAMVEVGEDVVRREVRMAPSWAVGRKGSGGQVDRAFRRSCLDGVRRFFVSDLNERRGG